ncbi:RidA family protein [Amycolatopsis jejuensis]|uniref:RidA family protein n=1 Tax=Amycolatopsis jejuensis TaxID=330084 RepID=UPI00052556C4|nr:RidA family protein [Amycolatopsis jejuensis]
MTPEDRLAAAGFVLPPPLPAVGGYVPVRIDDGVAYVSGHAALDGGKAVLPGRLGEDLTVEDGHRSAALAMVSALSTLAAEIGGLGHVQGILKLLVFVKATTDFAEHHLVANGASEVLTTAFGDAAAHARSAVGMSSLPFGISTEVEAVVALQNG